MKIYLNFKILSLLIVLIGISICSFAQNSQRTLQVQLFDTYGYPIHNVEIHIEKYKGVYEASIPLVTDVYGVAEFNVNVKNEVDTGFVHAVFRYQGVSLKKWIFVEKDSPSILRTKIYTHFENPYWDTELLKKWKSGEKQIHLTLAIAIQEIAKQEIPHDLANTIANKLSGEDGWKMRAFHKRQNFRLIKILIRDNPSGIHFINKP